MNTDANFAQYPKELQDLFHTKNRLIEPVTFLDYTGAELLLIPAKRHVADEVGQAEAQKLEDQAEDEAHKHKDMFKEVRSIPLCDAQTCMRSFATSLGGNEGQRGVVWMSWMYGHQVRLHIS